MKKIKYLFLSLLFIPLLTGCSIIKDLFNKDEEIEITYVFKDKTLVRTYSNYDKVTFETYNTTTGYTFLGWSLDNSNKVVSQNDLKGKSSVKLYPVLDLVKYNITYNLDGGTNSSDNPNYYTIESEITLSAPTKEGYAFSGWTTSTDSEPILNYKIEAGSFGDIELKANYVIGKVNVSFYGYEELNQIIDYNSLCTKPTDPVKFGDTFDFWATDDSLQTEFDFDTPIINNIVLYPKWKNTTFYTLTIENDSLISSNYASGSKLPKDATINLETKYVIENKEFIGWYIDSELYSKYYKMTYKMPKSNLTITPMFNDITTYEYYIGSNENLFTNITKESDGLLYGANIGNNYGHISNKLFISYYALDKLKPGLNSFVYESRIIINVFIKVKDKEVTNINVDYDINYPKTTLTFNEVEGYSYSYSLDGSSYISCHSGDTFMINNKLISHTIDIKCDDGTPTNYVIEAIPSSASSYLNDTFTYQGNTYDHYIDSDSDLKTIISYYALSKYPSVGGLSYEFSFYHPVGGDLSEKYAQIVKREISVPYGLNYQYTTSGKKIDFVLKSSGKFNSLSTSQERFDLTTTEFVETHRSESFNDFYIEKCSKTQEVRSIYELEDLDFNIKPIINDENVLLLYNKAKEILRNYVDDSMNEFEKVKAIYDYIGTYVTYDDVLLEITTNRSDYRSFTAYSALINGIAVCDGISSAFKLLCNIEGIECIEIIGSARTGGHAWNKVKIGGVWYGVDATWSRTDMGSIGKYLYHEYFLIDEVGLQTLGSCHYEQAEVNGTLLSYLNVDICANNNLNYYQLMMYDNYDLVCSSTSEYAKMYECFKDKNIKYIELYLDGVTYNEIKNIIPFSVYNIFYSNSDTHRVYLIMK